MAASPGLLTTFRKRLAEIVGGQSVSVNFSAADLLYGQVRVPPARGSWEFLLAYRSSPLLRMLTSKVSQSAASIDWYVEVDTAKGAKRIDDHPLPNLLKFGNEMITGYDCRKLAISHFLVTGEAHWLLERNMLGTPVGLLPLVPTWVVTTPRPGRPWYDVAVTEGGFIGKIAQSEVITFKDLDLYRPYDRGSGLAMALDMELGADSEAARYTAGYLANNARPDLIITANTTGGALGLKADEVDALQKAWLDKFQGPSRRGLPLVSSGDLKVTEVGKSMQEMQFIELRKWERDICISVFGVPPEMVGVLASSNKATVQAAQEIMGRQVVLPLLMSFRETMQQRLVPQFDKRLTLEFENPVPEDQERRNLALFQRPWMATINEHRTSTGFDPLPGPEGELFPEPITLTFVPSLGVATANADQEELQDISDVSTAAPLGRRKRRAPRRLKDIAKAAPKDDLDAIVNAADPDVMVRATKPVIHEVVRQFGDAAMLEAGVGIAFNLSDENVTGFIDQFGADRITGMVNQTTRDAIKDAINSVWDDGGTTADMVAGIQDVFASASQARARLIAATETNRAANFATHEAFDQAGTEGKEWLSTQDDRVRDTDEASHVDLDGQQVDMDEDFRDPASGKSGAYPGDFGDPAEDCNCRCGIVPVLASGNEEDAAASIYNTPAKRTKAWQDQERRKRSFERAMVPRVQVAFHKQMQAVIHEARRRFG